MVAKLQKLITYATSFLLRMKKTEYSKLLKNINSFKNRVC